MHTLARIFVFTISTLFLLISHHSATMALSKSISKSHYNGNNSSNNNTTKNLTTGHDVITHSKSGTASNPSPGSRVNFASSSSSKSSKKKSKSSSSDHEDNSSKSGWDVIHHKGNSGCYDSYSDCGSPWRKRRSSSNL
jgi:hypothetical protein